MSKLNSSILEMLILLSLSGETPTPLSRTVIENSLFEVHSRIILILHPDLL